MLAFSRGWLRWARPSHRYCYWQSAAHRSFVGKAVDSGGHLCGAPPPRHQADLTDMLPVSLGHSLTQPPTFLPQKSVSLLKGRCLVWRVSSWMKAQPLRKARPASLACTWRPVPQMHPPIWRHRLGAIISRAGQCSQHCENYSQVALQGTNLADWDVKRRNGVWNCCEMRSLTTISDLSKDWVLWLKIFVVLHRWDQIHVITLDTGSCEQWNDFLPHF